MNGLGENATMSIVSIGFTNTLFLDNVQGDFVAGSSMTYVTNTGIRSEINGSGSNVIIKSGGVTVDPLFDGKTIKVRHRNHAMHESNNLVKIDGIVSDLAPATLSNAYGRDSTADITSVQEPLSPHLKVLELDPLTLDISRYLTKSSNTLVFRATQLLV